MGVVCIIEKHGEVLFITPSQHLWTDFNDLYVTWRVFTQGVLGSRWYCSTYWGEIQIPKKTFWGRE